MPFVYSTASADTRYIVYKRVQTGDRSVSRPIPGKKGSVLIKGGANVAVAPHKSIVDPHGMPIHTPKGVRTEITDEQLEILRQIPAFVEHEKKGFMVVDNKQNADKVAKNMESKDKSAPMTPNDYKGKGKVTESKSGKSVDIELNELVEK